MINIQPEVKRKRKSERLTDQEKVALSTYVSKHSTIIDAATAIGIHRNVLDLVLLRGSGSPETVSRIRRKIKGA